MKDTIIISSLVNDDITTELDKIGIQYIKGGKSSNIDNETAYHPDMLFYPLQNGEILVEKGFVHNLDTFFKIKESKTKLLGKYPFDCRFNCFTAGNKLICGKGVAEEIKDDAQNAALDIVYVNQGYSACSTAKLNNDAFICSDIGIYKTLTYLGFDAIFVESEGIALNGYNCGFIGGCVLYTNKDIIAFSGCIENHKQYNDIKSFCANYNISAYSLSKSRLYDYGGFITNKPT